MPAAVGQHSRSGFIALNHTSHQVLIADTREFVSRVA